MTAALAALAAATATGAFWWIAAWTAKRRGGMLAPMPFLLPAGVGIAAGAAAQLGTLTATGLVALAAVAVAGLVDARTGAIVDPLNFAFFAAAAAASLGAGTFAAGLLGACAVGGALGTLYVLTRGAGIGLGDVKVGAGVGMALGWTLGLAAIGLAFVLGAAYGMWLLATKRASRRTAIRFGPFIAAGTFAAAIVPPVTFP